MISYRYEDQSMPDIEAERRTVARRLREFADKLEAGELVTVVAGICSSEGVSNITVQFDDATFICPCCNERGNVDFDKFVNDLAQSVLSGVTERLNGGSRLN
jgi:hypothetical protein